MKNKNETESATATNLKNQNKPKSKNDQDRQETHHHSSVARKGADPRNQILHSRVTRQFPSFPFFDFSSETREKSGSSRNTFLPQNSNSNNNRGHHPRNEKGLVPDGQRFYPSFNRNPPKRGSHLQNPFFTSDPHSGRRGGSASPFSNRRPSFRSHGAREAVNKPKFAFASNKFKDFGPVDNSILGSGNFEIIKGGTFYDEKNPHRNHYPFDPYLDNSYVVFPNNGNPHSHNHVDDFFSNFRDFSEFATRRSGKVQTYEPGFASEQVAQISSLSDMMTSETERAVSNITEITPPPVKFINVESLQGFSKENPTQIIIVMNSNQKSMAKPIKSSKLKKLNLSSVKKQKKIIKPKNIQEVLEEIDPFPSLTPPTVNPSNDEDPLIATY